MSKLWEAMVARYIDGSYAAVNQTGNVKKKKHTTYTVDLYPYFCESSFPTYISVQMKTSMGSREDRRKVIAIFIDPDVMYFPLNILYNFIDNLYSTTLSASFCQISTKTIITTKYRISHELACTCTSYRFLFTKISCVWP